ncbi:hypothetical protein ACPCXE_19720, partial [Bacillus velezensis]|uniref:hypothetical protein n=1 Tax=Bacillus velezensis TaxID=492670 RepID=UPI003C202E63
YPAGFSSVIYSQAESIFYHIMPVSFFGIRESPAPFSGFKHKTLEQLTVLGIIKLMIIVLGGCS